MSEVRKVYGKKAGCVFWIGYVDDRPEEAEWRRVNETAKHYINRSRKSFEMFIKKALAGGLEAIRPEEYAADTPPAAAQPAGDAPLAPRDSNTAPFGIERLREELGDLQAIAGRYLGGDIAERDIDAAIITSKKIAAIGNSAQKLLDGEAAPVKAQLDAINAKYKGVVNECKKLSQSIKRNAEAAAFRRKREAEAKAKAEQARIDAEKARLATEAQKLNPEGASIDELLQLQEQITENERNEKNLQAETRAATAVGVIGAKASFRTIPIATITDAAAFVKWVEENSPAEWKKLETAMSAAALRLFKSGDQPAGAVSGKKEVLA